MDTWNGLTAGREEGGVGGWKKVKGSANKHTCVSPDTDESAVMAREKWAGGGMWCGLGGARQRGRMGTAVTLSTMKIKKKSLLHHKELFLINLNIVHHFGFLSGSYHACILQVLLRRLSHSPDDCVSSPRKGAFPTASPSSSGPPKGPKK